MTDQKKAESVLARNRTWSSTFAESRAIQHTPRTFEIRKAAHRGIEPRLAESKSAVRSGTLAGRVVSSPSRNRTWSNSFGSCHAIQHTHEPFFSTPTWNRTRTRTLGGFDAFVTPSGQRADDWICTSMIRFTRPAPFYVEPRRQFLEQRCEESNPVRQFWRLSALPGAHRCIGCRPRC